MQYDDVSTQPDRPAVRANRNLYNRQETREEDIPAGVIGSLKIIAGGKDYIDEHGTDEIFLTLAGDNGSQRWTFGRAESEDFVISKKMQICSSHFIVEYTAGTRQRVETMVIRDVSRNGTRVNGRNLGRHDTALLKNDDVITVGAMDGVFTQDNQHVTSLMFTHYGETSFHEKYDLSNDLLGTGSFANVYRCVARVGGPARAVKVIPKSTLDPRSMPPHIVQREINVLKRTSHPGAVQLIDHFEDDKCYYLVMELIENGDLRDCISEIGAIPEFDSREIVRQVLETVRYYHARGITHRDIKPDNILVFQKEPFIVKMSDFGMAKNTQDSILNSYCGTPGYTAPEIIWTLYQRMANSADPGGYSNKVDLWSIGCLCYVLLTGRLPFEGVFDEAAAITSGVYNEEPLDYFNISPAGQDFIRCLLTVDPEKRPSASEILRHHWFSDESVGLRATNGEGADVSPQATLDSDKSQDIRPATITGDGPHPNSMPPLMEDDGSEIRSREEPISLEGLVLTDRVETQVGGAASEQARDAEMEARIHKELEARVRAENQFVQQAPAEQAARIRAAAEARRKSEAATDNDESDLEDGSAVNIPSASEPQTSEIYTRPVQLLTTYENFAYVVAEQAGREVKRIEKVRAEAARAEFNARSSNGAVNTPVRQAPRRNPSRSSRSGVEREGETVRQAPRRNALRSSRSGVEREGETVRQAPRRNTLRSSRNGDKR